MRRLLSFLGLLLGVLLPGMAHATPDRSKRVPLSFTGIDVFRDSALEDVYYILPNELVVDSSRFSSRATYAWRTLADGAASVEMVVRMYGSDDLIMQATREINQDTGQRVRYRGLLIRNPTVKVFEDPALVSAVDVTLSTNAGPLAREGSSFSKAALWFRLTKEGAALWKDAIRSGVFLVSGSISFEFASVDASGRESFVPVEIPLTVRNLPDPDKPFDATRSLLGLAAQRGEQYFYGQYASCRMFFENELFRAPAPRELESDDPTQSAEERALYAKTAQDVFAAAVTRQRALCANEVERLRGEQWMSTILSDRGLLSERGAPACGRASTLPPWSELFFAIHTNSPSFVAGAQKKYDDYKDYCSAPLEVVDFRVNMAGDCVRNLAVAFSESPDIATLSGNIVVYASDLPANRYSGFVVEKLEGSVLVFHFDTPLCRDTRDYVVELTEALSGSSGRRLSPAYTRKLDFAPRGVLRVPMRPGARPERMCIEPGAVTGEPADQACSVKALCTAAQGGLKFTRWFPVEGAVRRAALGQRGVCVEVGEWLFTLPAAARLEGCEAEVRCGGSAEARSGGSP